ncbi:MAG: DUF3857 domain-containing protein [Puniceicoccales bacterium]
MPKATRSSARTSKTLGRRAAFFLILCAAFCAGQLFPEEIAEGVTVTSAPEWADMGSPFIPGESPAYAEGGVYYHRTVDHFRPDEDAVFSQIAFEFQSKSGLEEYSTLVWNVDPEFEELQLHWIRVYRDGAWIDLLPEVDLEVVDARTDVRTWYYDDSKDVRIILKGVQVGDVLDYGYTRIGSNPIVKDYFSGSASLGFSVPVGSVEVRLDWPRDKEGLAYRTYPDVIEPSVYEEGAYRVYRWKMDQPEAVLVESRVPANFEILPWVQFSDWPEWGAVARWAAELYPLEAEIPPLLEKEAARIRESGDSPLEQATQALQFVQDAIRYVSIPVGPHSYQPYPPAIITERRYGDCKDKSLLLVLLLRELGIDANLVLVSTEDRQLLARRLPTQAAFDHVLVQALIEGESVWMDPTDSQEGGVLPDRYFGNYGYGLVVSQDTTALTRHVGPQGSAAASSATTETFTFAGYDQPVTLAVESEYRGRNADNVRWDLASDGLDAFARSYTNYYGMLYDRVPEAMPLEVEDRREENVVTIKESYRMPALFVAEAENESAIVNFPAEIIRDQIPEPSEKIRLSPFALNPPLRQYQTIRIQLPDSSQFTEEDFERENEWFRYLFSVRQEESTLEIHHEFELVSDSVPLDRLEEYQAEVNEVKEYLDYYIEVDLTAVLGDAPSGFFGAIRRALAEPVGLKNDVEESGTQEAGEETAVEGIFAAESSRITLTQVLGISFISFLAGMILSWLLLRRGAA